MNEKERKPGGDTAGMYYPRKMAHGWCVAHPVTACGITIERYGTKYRTYREAYERAMELNRRLVDEELRQERGRAGGE